MQYKENKMYQLFIKRIEELEISDKEKEFILENISICTKIYLRGIRDSAFFRHFFTFF